MIHCSYCITAAYPQSSLNGTPTCSSLNGTTSYVTYVVGERNLDVYNLYI